MTAPAAPKKGDRVRVTTFEGVYDSPAVLGDSHWVTLGGRSPCCLVPGDLLEVVSPPWETTIGSVIRFRGKVPLTFICYGADLWGRYGDPPRTGRALGELRADHGEPTVLYDASKS